MFYRVSGRVLLLAAVALTTWVLWPRSPASGQPSGARADEVKYYGTASCSSMACHNFNGPEGAARSEVSTWSNGDRHSQAFTVLFNDRSARIVKNLDGVSPDIIPGKKATEQEFCLRCHATHTGTWDAKADRMVGTHERFVLADGVSCEACHGPAQTYLTAHFQSGFKELPPERKEKDYGLLNTKDLVKRAQLCVTCHVGDATKEVNHDLIAAGHPRLNFELAGYHGIYHKHWSDEAERARNKDFYARIWLIGQLVSAKASLDLLALRADGESKKYGEKGWRPWPELAEYACYACHQDLNVKLEKDLEKKYATRKPGTFPYGTWYLAAVDTPLGGDPGYVSGTLLAKKKELQGLMQRPAPPAGDVAKAAREMSGGLEQALTALSRGNLAEARLRLLLERYAREGKEKGAALSWDEATQLYLAIAALAQARTDAGTPTLTPGAGRDELLALKGGLRGAFPKKGYDSPKLYNPQVLSGQFDAILNRLGK